MRRRPSAVVPPVPPASTAAAAIATMDGIGVARVMFACLRRVLQLYVDNVRMTTLALAAGVAVLWRRWRARGSRRK